MGIKVKQIYKKVKKHLKSVLQSETKEAQVFESDGTRRCKAAEYFMKSGDWVKENASPENDYIRLRGQML